MLPLNIYAANTNSRYHFTHQKPGDANIACSGYALGKFSNKLQFISAIIGLACPIVCLLVPFTIVLRITLSFCWFQHCFSFAQSPGRLVRFLFRHHSTGSSKSSPLHRDRNRIKLIPHLHRHSYATFVVRPKNTSPTHPWPGYWSKSSHAVIYFHINPGTN